MLNLMLRIFLTNIEIKTRHFRPMWVVYFIVNELGKIKDI